MSSRGWKTLRVLVELKVDGPLTERDLTRMIEAKLADRWREQGGDDLRAHVVNRGNRVGRLQVKSFGRVRAALSRWGWMHF